MTNHTVRLYAAAVALATLFGLWMIIAGSPWRSSAKPAQDARLEALRTRERQLRTEAAAVQRRVQRRWVVYERRLRARRREIAAVTQRHEEQLAAAQRAEAARRAALAAIAAQSRPTAAAAPVSISAPSPSATPAAPAAAQPPRVVVLPPKVQVVNLPPITVSKSS